MKLSFLSRVFGLFGLLGDGRADAKSVGLKLDSVRPSFGLALRGSERAWFSLTSEKEFRNKQLERRALNESVIRLPVAR